MKTRLMATASLWLALVAAHMAIAASPSTQVQPLDTPDQPGAISLYPDGVPGSEQAPQRESWLNFYGQRVVHNVVQPTLTPVLPDAARATGAAVIIAPGGAFMMLSIDSEGYAVARWLADHGIAAFVLKYRLDPTPDDPAAFSKALMARMSGAARPGNDAELKQTQALADAQQAVRLVRQRAAEWGVDPARIGLLGFSAGAITALNVVLAGEPDSRPAFVAPIYGPTNSVTVPVNAPPLFVAMASDDPLFGNKGFGLVEAWTRARRPAELHVYEKGGHGFGMNHKGTTSDGWIDDFYRWLQARKLLDRSTSPTH